MKSTIKLWNRSYQNILDGGLFSKKIPGNVQFHFCVGKNFWPFSRPSENGLRLHRNFFIDNLHANIFCMFFAMSNCNFYFIFRFLKIGALESSILVKGLNLEQLRLFLTTSWWNRNQLMSTLQFRMTIEHYAKATFKWLTTFVSFKHYDVINYIIMTSSITTSWQNQCENRKTIKTRINPNAFYGFKFRGKFCLAISHEIGVF